MNIQVFNDEELVASEKDKTLISSKAKNIWVTKKTLWQFSSREAANIKHKRMTCGKLYERFVKIEFSWIVG